jgi:hypothetical protein
MEMSKKIPLVVLSLLLLAQVSPVPVRGWRLVEGALQPVALPGRSQPMGVATQGDLDQDGVNEIIKLSSDRATILHQDMPVWQSPESWEVTQGFIADLNRDGLPEAALLVWRPFKPWPIDRYVPNRGRIDAFHDAQGRSCQVILIGGSRGSYHEAWAGSALAEPVKQMAAADLDGDGYPELITVDSRYSDGPSTPPWALSIWEWNGFGFSLVTRIERGVSTILAERIPGTNSDFLIGN